MNQKINEYFIQGIEELPIEDGAPRISSTYGLKSVAYNIAI